jgi:sialate O-acetylesterase
VSTGAIRAALLGMLFAVPNPTEAALRFARIFSDHAVLQQDREIHVWGSGATSGQSLELVFGSARIAATVSRAGNWTARLPAQAANRTGRTLKLLAGGNTAVAIDDVLVGEVWLAAGQSNMQFPVRQIVRQLPAAKAWVAGCQLPTVRLRRINDPVLEDPNSKAADLQPTGAWFSMTPESVVSFSAVAAVYARELHENLGVPVGIIDVSWGGKPIEPFIPREQFSSPLLITIRQLADTGAIDELARLPGGVIIRNPQGHPGAIFNARMHPLAPYGLRGFIWYQAESNCGKGEDPRHYRFKQEAMIAGWRKSWADDRLPCYYVQLPSFPTATGWIRMREEQRLALSVPNTGMAVTIDVRGEGIHPPDKLSVGRRLAQIALAKTYDSGPDDVTGPTYQSHSISGRSIRIQFADVGDGLMIGDKLSVAPAAETPGQALRWFEVADRNGKWHPATALIDGTSVVVSSKEVNRPVAARYACHVRPQGGNLYNRTGYPASPFCTDLKLLPWTDHGAER